MLSYAEKVFAYLKTKKPGDLIKVNDDRGNPHQVTLVRRGRQNVRIDSTEREFLGRVLISLQDVILEEPVKV